MRVERIIPWGVALGFAVFSVCSGQNYTNLNEVLSNLDVNLVGAGARAEGLGGAFIGVADDATSILWNPAGLATLERPEASIVIRNISQKAEYTDTDNPADNNTQNVNQFALNFGSVAYPLRSGGGNIVLAVAFQQQINLRKAFKTSAELDYENTGGVNTISPGIGVKLLPFLSIGAAANVWLGHLDQNDIDSYDLYDTSGVFQRRNVTHTSSSGTFSGTNFVFGLLLDFSDMNIRLPLKVGLSLKTPFDLKQNFSGTYEDPTYGNNSWDGSQTIQMPLMLGLGASYQIGDNFTIALDYEMRQFKDKKVITDYSFSYSDTLNVSESNQNLNQLRIGAEYLIVTSAGVFPVRAGFRTVPTVLANQNPFYDANFNYNPGYGGQVSGSAFSVGTGYISDRFALDVAYSATSYNQALSSSSNTKYSVGVLSASMIFYF